MHQNEEEENIEEVTVFKIDESKSTSNSKFIIRKRRRTHTCENRPTWTEYFEDTFTIPLHKFNLNLILSQTKIENIEETIIVQKKILKQNILGKEVHIEELSIPTDLVNLESVLPLIDFSEITNFSIVERRKEIIRKKVSFVFT